MRVFFRRVRHGWRPVHRPAGHRPSAHRRLLPGQVREQRFRPAPLGRRGLDQVAGELAVVHDALAQSRREVSRIKSVLCQLQSERGPARNEREWHR
jgi:hypothetical protein